MKYDFVIKLRLFLARPQTDVDQILGEQAKMGIGHNICGRIMIAS